MFVNRSLFTTKKPFFNPLFKSSKVFTEEDKAETKRMIVDVYT